jgi:two-component system KDP operon response regulator KdpE
MQHPANSDSASQPDRKVRVLVAEDDDDIRSVFEMVLGDVYEIRSAGTAAEALGLAATWTPDVVLLDWTLPDASGDDVVRRLRALKSEFENLPIVVVSGAPTVKSLAAEVGAVPCPKPCDIDQLTAAIELALAPTRKG